LKGRNYYLQLKIMKYEKNVMKIILISINNIILGGCPAERGSLDFWSKHSFPSFFVSEKGLT